jgi:hypothetical protein
VERRVIQRTNVPPGHAGGQSSPGFDRDVYVRVIPDKISGRRIESR